MGPNNHRLLIILTADLAGQHLLALLQHLGAGRVLAALLQRLLLEVLDDLDIRGGDLLQLGAPCGARGIRQNFLPLQLINIFGCITQ